MGEVYKARDTRLGRTVAIKVASQKFSERFEREAKALAALNHPNICILYDVGPNYLVMEFVEGSPVAATADIPALLELTIQMADGMAAAHAAGIVHRDLKPGNILVSREGRVKILDFGLAIQEPSSAPAPDATLTMAITDPGTTVGTVAYMSPEQARGQTVDARSDLWSLGVILYEMATHVRPFEGPTAAVLFEGILTKAPKPVRERNPTVPVELERIIGKLLEKNRDLRYQSATEVRADLKRVERDSGSAPAVVPAPKPLRKYGVAAAVVLVLAGAGAFLWNRAHAAPLTDKDVVVLADFTNSTGDPVFDGTLRQALAIQLEQSPFLQIMDDQQMRQDLPFMGRKADERITNQVAHDICVRENEKAMIAGAIASLGKTYALTLEATNCQTGATLARVQTEAEDKEHVLRAVSTAANGIRGKLGESLASVKKLDHPLDEQVTTSSLEAFQAFSRGIEESDKGLPLAAIPFLKRATELDPNFARAYGALGAKYGNVGETGRSVENVKKAFELRDRVTERERLQIEGIYFLNVAGDLNKALETTQMLAQAYPREMRAQNGLGGIYARIGEFDKELAAAQVEARIVPGNAFTVLDLMNAYARLDRFDEAKAVAEKASAQGLDFSLLHRSLLRIAFRQGDGAAANKQIAWFKSKPEEFEGLSEQATQAITLGQRRKAAELRRRAADLAKGLDLPSVTRAALGAIDADAAIAGDCSPSGKGLRNDLVAALCGDASSAQKVIDTANRPAGDQSLYLKALIALREHKNSDAVAAFQNILDHKGAYYGPYYALSHLGLARAAALTGDKPKARKAYQDFLALWKDADADLPLLIQARKEYSGF
jgi:Flp pilus assembly protein TadD